MTILEKVKNFLVRLVKDEAFTRQLQSGSTEQAWDLLRDAGYIFTQEEFESATLQLLDLKERDEFEELTEAELVGAIGGLIAQEPIFQPMYGVVVEPPQIDPIPFPRPRKPFFSWLWKPPVYPKPLYGVVIQPLEPPIIQPMYGAITPPSLQ